MKAKQILDNGNAVGIVLRDPLQVEAVVADDVPQVDVGRDAPGAHDAHVESPTARGRF